MCNIKSPLLTFFILIIIINIFIPRQFLQAAGAQLPQEDTVLSPGAQGNILIKTWLEEDGHWKYGEKMAPSVKATLESYLMEMDPATRAFRLNLRQALQNNQAFNDSNYLFKKYNWMYSLLTLAGIVGTYYLIEQGIANGHLATLALSTILGGFMGNIIYGHTDVIFTYLFCGALLGILVNQTYSYLASSHLVHELKKEQKLIQEAQLSAYWGAISGFIAHSLHTAWRMSDRYKSSHFPSREDIDEEADKLSLYITFKNETDIWIELQILSVGDLVNNTIGNVMRKLNGFHKPVMWGSHRSPVFTLHKFNSDC